MWQLGMAIAGAAPACWPVMPPRGQQAIRQAAARVAPVGAPDTPVAQVPCEASKAASSAAAGFRKLSFSGQRGLR
jgi:hypothetical protein